MRPSPYILLIATMALWAAHAVVARAVHEIIPPVSLSFWRWTAVAAILLPLAGREVWRHRDVVRRHWRVLLALAASGVVGFNVCLYIALQSTVVINASLVNSIAPVLIPLISFVLTRERVSPRQAIGIALSLLGAVIIISRADVAVLAGLQFTPGDLWMLPAITAWAIYSALLRWVPAELPPLAMLTTITIMGWLIICPLYAMEYRTLGGFELNWFTGSSIVFIALLVTVVGFYWYNLAVAEVGPTRTGITLHLIPVFAVAMAMVLLGEELHPFHLVGAAFIVAGIYVTVRGPQPPAATLGS